ncbi:MarC family protein [Falsigemmobacter intermedius]|uniref:UPF0056 membrane protein n=1 Tax=Falsigemmobacter intermedius TaxID=1553448 RepID=A0A3S3UFZ8_9RHOB|nr:MarC family protein [Falsigemmobacter intermedius]RWY43009.1 MarC family protein [Falsigemmobacter intermedius]
MIDATFLLTVFTTLIVILDPIALAPLFIPLTAGMSSARRRQVAIRACLTAAGILTVFALIGDGLLRLTGISLPAFRVAGGVLLFLTALDMLFERRTQRRENKVDEKTHEADHSDHDDPSVFPLGIPLIAGPGAIASMILLISQGGGDWAAFLVVEGVMLGVMFLCFLSLLAAGAVERLLGRTGTLVVTRLLGMLLAALAIQFIIDGIKGSGLLD